MPYRLNIAGLYRVEIPDEVHIGRGYYIPIPHHRLRFSLIHAFVYIPLVVFIGYKIYTHKPSSFTVAQDGSGDFTTVSQAVAAAPDHSSSPFRIYIKKGTYLERVKVGQAKTNIFFIGDGINKTVISFNRSGAEFARAYDTATLYVRGDGFVARDMTIRNSATPSDHGPGAAFTSEGNQTALHNCRLDALRQPTVYARYGMHFYGDCHIYGVATIIFGRATAVFQNCYVYARYPPQGHTISITAQGRSSAGEHTAFSLHNCTIVADPELGTEGRLGLRGRGFLGFPWRPFSMTVVMQSYLDTLIEPKGWLQYQNSSNTLYYDEYGNRGPGAETRGRVKWPGYTPALTTAAAMNFTVAKLIGGDEWLPRTRVPYTAGLM